MKKRLLVLVLLCCAAAGAAHAAETQEAPASSDEISHTKVTPEQAARQKQIERQFQGLSQGLGRLPVPPDVKGKTIKLTPVVPQHIHTADGKEIPSAPQDTKAQTE
ncbi:MAG TPA: hypothetical protein VL688_06525 [Verrucomicrobiae bacterium]|nr:hypothetical protein [Verrucomicrobiae bacterium]